MLMKEIVCKNCGSKDLCFINNCWVCNYCDSKFLASEDQIRIHKQHNMSSRNLQIVSSNIDLVSDVEQLLVKCRQDKKNAKRYANLILDIDPDNQDALKYL